MPKTVKRASSTAARNTSPKTELPNLKTVVLYDLRDIRKTADTLYWGGRWPDDFFLGTRGSGEAPKQTDIADVFDWLANMEEMGRFGGVDGFHDGELGMDVLYHAASLELRLPPVPQVNPVVPPHLTRLLEAVILSTPAKTKRHPRA